VKTIDFGWIIPVEGAVKGQDLPLVLGYESTILPAIARRFQSVWVYDHFYAFSDPLDCYLESWTTLTWLAARFPGLDVGTIVLGIGYRNPGLLAKMAATLSALSNGRLILGLGAGWREEEYRAYGYPFPRAGIRIAQLEEAVQVIRNMWTQPKPVYSGEYFSIDGAYCNPKPPAPCPIMIGGDGEKKMLPLVGRLADWWNAGGGTTAEDTRRKIEIIRTNAEQSGRSLADIRLTKNVSDRPWPKSSADSREWVEFLAAFVEQGFSYYMVDAQPESVEDVERFGEEVIAVLQSV
jgi:hypothetical protein